MDLVREVLAATEQRGLARAKIIDEPRVKGKGSLRKKAQLRGWSATEAFDSCDDAVGVRVVCNNLADVRRFVDLLGRRLAGERDGPYGADQPLEVRIEDHLTAARPDGYRAVHVKFRLWAPDGSRFGSMSVGCEVQVRSLLQDGWARLSHHDIYKTEDLPDDLKARFRDMSRTLQPADETAQEIRERITALREAPDDRPDLGRVTEEGIAYLFATTYGMNPPDYLIGLALRSLEELEVESLTELEKVLTDEELRERMERSYSKALHWGSGMSPVDHFLLAAFAVSQGSNAAVRKARKRGKEEREEIESQARSHVLGELPDTAEEFLEDLEAGEINLDAVAEQFGARNECGVCGADIVEPESFEEGASDHYHYDFEGRVSRYIYDCGIETGGFNNSSLCSYHENAMLKDD